MFSPSPTGCRLRFNRQATNVFSLWPQSVPGRWSPVMGVLAWFVSDVGTSFHRRRPLVYCRLHMRSFGSERARGFPGVDSISPCRTNGPSAARVREVLLRYIKRLALQSAL